MVERSEGVDYVIATLPPSPLEQESVADPNLVLPPFAVLNAVLSGVEKGDTYEIYLFGYALTEAEAQSYLVHSRLEGATVM